MPPTNEDDVKIQRHKRMLEQLRDTSSEEATDASIGKQSGSGSGVGIRYAENRVGGDGKAPQGSNGTANRNESRTGRDGQGSGRVAENSRTIQGSDKGVRPTDRPRIDSNKSTGDVGGRPEGGIGSRDFTFQLKNPFKGKSGPKEPVRLFSKIEADESYDRMYDIYFRGSSLLDDVLEIVVKDHEPVTIWQLSPEEAEMLATMHLQRATYDKKAAESARQLLALYDRLYLWLLALPRLKLTGEHIKEHGGLSFK